MNNTYPIYGLNNKYITHNWCGRGCPPYRIKVLYYGEVWTNDGNIRRSFFNYYPPDDDYIYVTDDMSDDMRKLSELCREYRLLDGDIQWVDYADNVDYRAYVDGRASEWLEWLLNIREYWINCEATKEYVETRNIIHTELMDFEAQHRQLKKKKSFIKSNGNGTARFWGKDIPQKIDEDEDTKPIGNDIEL